MIWQMRREKNENHGLDIIFRTFVFGDTLAPGTKIEQGWSN